MAVALVVLFLLVVVVAGGIVVARRRGGTESHSVDNYRHTLETLQDIGSRTGSRSVRVLGGAQEAGQGAEAPVHPPGAHAPGSHAPGAHAPGTHPTPEGLGAGSEGPVAPDAGAVGSGGVTIQGPGDPVRRNGAGAARALHFEDAAVNGAASGDFRPSSRTQARALSAAGHRPRRLGAPVAVAVVVVVVLAVVVALGAHANGHNKTGITVPTSSGVRTTPTSAPTTASGGKGRTTATTAAHGHGRTTTSSTTTTTLPRRFAPTTATATSATYAPPTSSYTLTFATGSGPCWVNVSSSSGSTVFSQTIPAGQRKAVPATGTVTVILGAPSSVTVTIDRLPAVLPTGFQTPFTMTMKPTSPTAGSGSAKTAGSGSAKTAGSGAGRTSGTAG